MRGLYLPPGERSIQHHDDRGSALQDAPRRTVLARMRNIEPMSAALQHQQLAVEQGVGAVRTADEVVRR